MLKFSKLALLSLCLMLVVGAFSACGEKDKDADKGDNVPKEVQEVKDKVTDVADKHAKKLDGDFGDKYKALLKDGDNRDMTSHKELEKELQKIREESGGKYVYLLNPTKDDKPSLDGNTKDGKFAITVDGSEEPDAWGTAYDWEPQFLEAWEGEPAAARSAWSDNDEGTELCWSAFAPIHDSDGNVVAILGVDYPANEILDFPEWNRDAAEWNGITE